MFAQRCLTRSKRLFAGLSTALVLVLCLQFVVVGVERIEHLFNVDHSPISLAGTVVDEAHVAAQFGKSTAWPLVHESEVPDEHLDHGHLADAAPGCILIISFVAVFESREPADFQPAVPGVLSGLPSSLLERPPNFLC